MCVGFEGRSAMRGMISETSVRARRLLRSVIAIIRQANGANPSGGAERVPKGTREMVDIQVALPKFSELPVFEQTGERYAWDVWGRDDELGMVNLLTPERVRHAVSLVKQ